MDAVFASMIESQPRQSKPKDSKAQKKKKKKSKKSQKIAGSKRPRGADSSDEMVAALRSDGNETSGGVASRSGSAGDSASSSPAQPTAKKRSKAVAAAAAKQDIDMLLQVSRAKKRRKEHAARVAAKEGKAVAEAKDDLRKRLEELERKHIALNGGSDPSEPKPVRTEDGLPIYTVDSLSIGKGGGTPQCPFDCSCCF